MTNEITPCDKIIIPVFSTYACASGLKACREMFEEAGLICLRWTDKRGTHQALAERPAKWANNENFWNPCERKWLYD